MQNSTPAERSTPRFEVVEAYLQAALFSVVPWRTESGIVLPFSSTLSAPMRASSTGRTRGVDHQPVPVGEQPEGELGEAGPGGFDKATRDRRLRGR